MPLASSLPFASCSAQHPSWLCLLSLHILIYTPKDFHPHHHPHHHPHWSSSSYHPCCPILVLSSLSCHPHHHVILIIMSSSSSCHPHCPVILIVLSSSSSSSSHHPHHPIILIIPSSSFIISHFSSHIIPGLYHLFHPS